MSKKTFLFLAGIVFFSSFHLAHASLTINEVMYDLSGSDSTSGKSREWIEIYNSDTSDVAVDASKWRIYDGSANRTMNGEVNFSFPAQSYVILAGDKDTFLADNAGFGGVVYDTGITTLNNTGATLKLLDQDGNVVDSVTYASSQGGAGDGNSLQKISGSWVGATPTPGVTNEVAVVSSSSQSSSPIGNGGSALNSDSIDSSTQNSVTIANKSKTTEEQKIKTHITAKTLIFNDVPVLLQATSLGYNKDQLHYGKYFWNFGDGDSKEINLNGASNAEEINHTYFYPGDYTVNLEYYLNPYLDTPDAFDKITITVVPTDISISRVGDEKDFFVEIANNTNYDVDISNWILASDTKNFTFPKDTVINSKKKMIVSPHLTNFSVQDKSTLKLMTPQGRVVYDCSSSVASSTEVKSTPTVTTKSVVKNVIPTKVSTSKNVSTAKKDSAKILTLPIAPVENLGASVSSSDVVKNDSISYSSIIVAVVFIGASAGAVYFIRRKKNIPKIGDDFNILDE